MFEIFRGPERCMHEFELFFGLDSDFTTLCLPRMLTSTIPVNGSKAALLSNNILHNKYATKKILPQALVVITNFIKKFRRKKFVSYLKFWLFCARVSYLILSNTNCIDFPP